MIGPGGYLLIQFDSTAPASGVNTGFGLNADGDALYLLASPAAGGGVVDSIAFGCQAADLTIGRVGPDRQWSLCQPTYGLPTVAVTLGDPRQLKINEWMARPVSGSDWFEIFNPLPQHVAFGPQQAGVSEGRLPDGASSIAPFVTR